MCDVVKKPPIGLRPEWVAAHEYNKGRIVEIVEAMKRYAEVGELVPLDWCTELDLRIKNFVVMANAAQAAQKV